MLHLKFNYFALPGDFLALFSNRYFQISLARDFNIVVTWSDFKFGDSF